MENERDREDLLVNFIPINRDLFDHYLWVENREYSKFEAWLYLLKEARFKESKVVDNGYVVIVKRGQVYASLGFLAEAFGWTIKRVRTFLTMLESDNMITKEPHKETRQNIITITNYDKYNIVKRDSKVSTESKKDETTFGTSQLPSPETTIPSEENTGSTIIVDGEEKYIHQKLYSAYNEIIANEEYLYSIYRNSPIKDLDLLKTKHLPEFLSILTMRGDTDKPLREVVSHFANWLLEQHDKQQKEKGGKNGATTPRSAYNAANNKPAEKTPKDYTGGF